MIKKVSGALMALIAFAIMAGMSSCSSPKNIAYLQDSVVGVAQPVSSQSNIVARPGDRLSILVNCPDPQTAAMFALISPQRTMEYGTSTGATGQAQMSYYQVSKQGTIEFPILGTVSVAGLTAPEIAEKIKNELVKRQLVKDPVVIADFTNLHYSVLGEVNSPGQYPINNNRVTLMEALAAAGDLTIFGKRENVKVVREENGQRMTYVVDLRNDKLFDSPVYYLQQNDVVYVEPNQKKTGESTMNENQWKQPGLWISIASFLTTIAVLIWR